MFYEDELQRAVVKELLIWEALTGDFTFAHVPNEGMGLQAYAIAELVRQGLRAGEPDLIFYIRGGKVLLVELKRTKGVLSKAQKNRHSVLDKLGFEVYTVKPESIESGIEEVLSILRGAGVRIPERRKEQSNGRFTDTAAG